MKRDDAAAVTPSSDLELPAKACPGPRDTYIDSARGIGILLVVFGHSIIYANPGGAMDSIERFTTQLIYSFHMPLLFAISGFVMYGRVRKPYGRWIRDKATRLLTPFVAWYTLPYLLTSMRSAGPRQWLEGLMLHVVAGIRRPEDGLWYLWTLFWCLFLLAVARRLSARHDAVVCGSLILAALLAHRFGEIDGFGIGSVATYAPWFLAGYILAWKGASNPLRPVLAVGAAAGALAAVFVLQDPALGEWARVISALSPVMGIYVAISLATAAQSVKARSALEYLGRESMGIYVCHMFILGVWATVLHMPLPDGLGGALITTAAFTTLALAATTALRATPLSRVIFLGEPVRRTPAVVAPATMIPARPEATEQESDARSA